MLEKSSFVERVLIVLNPDGTLRGAHQHTLDTITDDGAVIRESQGDAVPLDAAALSAVLPTQAALASQVQALQSQVEALSAENDALRSQAAVVTPDLDLSTAIKHECERRIYAVADTNTQMNMVAAAVTGLLDDAGRTALASAVAWVAGMRQSASALIANADSTYASDAHWPACPPEVVALAQSF